MEEDVRTSGDCVLESGGESGMPGKSSWKREVMEERVLV
jgi:hypothetical protein